MEAVLRRAADNEAEQLGVGGRLRHRLGGDGDLGRADAGIDHVVERAPHVLVKVAALFRVFPIDVELAVEDARAALGDREIHARHTGCGIDIGGAVGGGIRETDSGRGAIAEVDFGVLAHHLEVHQRTAAVIELQAIGWQHAHLLCRASGANWNFDSRHRSRERHPKGIDLLIVRQICTHVAGMGIPGHAGHMVGAEHGRCLRTDAECGTEIGYRLLRAEFINGRARTTDEEVVTGNAFVVTYQLGLGGRCGGAEYAAGGLIVVVAADAGIEGDDVQRRAGIVGIQRIA